MRWPSGAAVTLLFLVAAASAQRGSRRFSSSTDNTLTEEDVTVRSHRFQNQRHRETNEVEKSVPRNDFPHRDAEIVSPTRSSPRASYRSRNEVSSRDLHSRKEVPIVSSGAVEYERLQNAEPTRRTITPRPTSSARAAEDNQRGSTRNQSNNSQRRNPIAQEASRRPNARDGSRVPGRGDNNGRAQSVSSQEETTPKSFSRPGSTRGSLRSSSQTETESPKIAETHRPSFRGRDDHRRLSDAQTTTDTSDLRRNQETPRPSSRGPEVRGRTGGRNLQLENDDNQGDVRSRARTSSRGSTESHGRQAFRSRGSNVVSKADEPESTRGGSRTSGRFTERTESDSRGRTGLRSRAKYEDTPVEPVAPSLPPSEEPILSLQPENEPKFEEPSFASPTPPAEREIRTASPLSRGAPKGNSRGRGTARASPSDLRAGGLKQKEADEVSDSDNYPEVYKQLKKSGTDPKEILVPKYKQIISKYSKSTKDDSRHNVGTGTISYKFPEFTPSSHVGSSTSTVSPVPVTTTRKTINQYQTTRSTLARNPDPHVSGLRNSGRNHNRNGSLNEFADDIDTKKNKAANYYPDVEFSTRKTYTKQTDYEHTTPIYDEIVKTGKDRNKGSFHVSKESSDYWGRAKYDKNSGSEGNLKWPFDTYSGSYQDSRIVDRYNIQTTVKAPESINAGGLQQSYDDFTVELPIRKKPKFDWDIGVVHSESFGATKTREGVSNIRSVTTARPTERPFNAANPSPVKNNKNIWAGIYDDEQFKPIQPKFVQPKDKFPIASIRFDNPESSGYKYGGLHSEVQTPGYVFHDFGAPGAGNPFMSPIKQYNNYWTTERVFTTPGRNFVYDQPKRDHVFPNTPNPIHDSHVSVTFNQGGGGSWGVDYSLKNHRFREFAPPKARTMAERAIEDDGKAQNLYQANSYLAEKSRKFEMPPTDGKNDLNNNRGTANTQLIQGSDSKDLKSSPSVDELGNRGRTQSNNVVQIFPSNAKPVEPVVLRKPQTPVQTYPKLAPRKPSGTEFDITKSNAIFEQTIFGKSELDTEKCVYCPTTPSSLDNVAYTVTLNGRKFHKVENNPKVEIDHRGTTKHFDATTPQNLRNPLVAITPPFISRSKIPPKNDPKYSTTFKPTDHPQNAFGFWSPYDEVAVKTTTKPPKAKTLETGDWNPYRGLRRSTTPTSTAITSPNSIEVTKKYQPTIYPINLKKTTTTKPGVKKSKADDNQSNNILLNLALLKAKKAAREAQQKLNLPHLSPVPEPTQSNVNDNLPSSTVDSPPILAGTRNFRKSLGRRISEGPGTKRADEHTEIDPKNGVRTGGPTRASPVFRSRTHSIETPNENDSKDSDVEKARFVPTARRGVGRSFTRATPAPPALETTTEPVKEPIYSTLSYSSVSKFRNRFTPKLEERPDEQSPAKPRYSQRPQSRKDVTDLPKVDPVVESTSRFSPVERKRNFPPRLDLISRTGTRLQFRPGSRRLNDDKDAEVLEEENSVNAPTHEKIEDEQEEPQDRQRTANDLEERLELKTRFHQSPIVGGSERPMYVPRDRLKDKEKFRARTESNEDEETEPTPVKPRYRLYDRENDGTKKKVLPPALEITTSSEKYKSKHNLYREGKERPSFALPRKVYTRPTSTSLPLPKYKQKKDVLSRSFRPTSRPYSTDLDEEEGDEYDDPLRRGFNGLTIDSLVSESETIAVTTEPVGKGTSKRPRKKYGESHVYRIPPRKRPGLSESSTMTTPFVFPTTEFLASLAQLTAETTPRTIEDPKEDEDDEKDLATTEGITTPPPIMTTSTTSTTTTKPTTKATTRKPTQKPKPKTTRKPKTTKATTVRSTTPSPSTTVSTTEEATSRTTPKFLTNPPVVVNYGSGPPSKNLSESSTVTTPFAFTTMEFLASLAQFTAETTPSTVEDTKEDEDNETDLETTEEITTPPPVMTTSTTTTTTTKKPTTKATTRKPTPKPKPKTTRKPKTTKATTVRPTTTSPSTTVSTSQIPSTVSTTEIPSTVSTTEEITTPPPIMTTSTTTTTTTTKKPTTKVTTRKPTQKPKPKTTRKPKTTKATTVRPTTTSPSTTVPTSQIPSTMSTTEIPSTVSTPRIPSTVSTTQIPSTVSTTRIPSTEGAPSTTTPKILTNPPVAVTYGSGPPSTTQAPPTSPMPETRVVTILSTIAQLANNLTAQTTTPQYGNTAKIMTYTQETTPIPPPQNSTNFVVYGLLPNNNLVRKVIRTTPSPIDVPFIIYGLYPNGTIVRRYPNGTVLPEETETLDNEVIANIEPGNKKVLEEVVRKDSPLAYLYPPNLMTSTEPSMVTTRTTHIQRITTAPSEPVGTTTVPPTTSTIASTTPTTEKVVEITTRKVTTKATTVPTTKKPTTAKVTTMKPGTKRTTNKPRSGAATTKKPKTSQTTKKPGGKSATTTKTTVPTSTTVKEDVTNATATTAAPQNSTTESPPTAASLNVTTAGSISANLTSTSPSSPSKSTAKPKTVTTKADSSTTVSTTTPAPSTSTTTRATTAKPKSKPKAKPKTTRKPKPKTTTTRAPGSSLSDAELLKNQRLDVTNATTTTAPPQNSTAESTSTVASLNMTTAGSTSANLNSTSPSSPSKGTAKPKTATTKAPSTTMSTTTLVSSTSTTTRATTAKPKSKPKAKPKTTRKPKPKTTTTRVPGSSLSDVELLNNVLKSEKVVDVMAPAADSEETLANKVIQLAIERATQKGNNTSTTVPMSLSSPASPVPQNSTTESVMIVTPEMAVPDVGTPNNATGKISLWVIEDDNTTTIPVKSSTVDVDNPDVAVINAILSTPGIDQLSVREQLILADVLSSTAFPPTTEKRKKKKPKTTTTTTTTTPRPAFPLLRALFGRSREPSQGSSWFGGLFRPFRNWAQGRGLFGQGGGAGLTGGYNTFREQNQNFGYDGAESVATGSSSPSPAAFDDDISGVNFGSGQGIADVPPEAQRGLVGAAINVSRAVSQFMGFVIQGATQSFQNYLQTRTAALANALTNGPIS